MVHKLIGNTRAFFEKGQRRFGWRRRPKGYLAVETGLPGRRFPDIQDAINYLNPGGRIFQYEGTYQRNTEASLDEKDLVITGCSKAASVLQNTATSGAVIHMYGKSTISDLTIRGSGKADSGTGVYADAADSTAWTNGVMKDLIIEDLEHGVRLLGNIWNIRGKNIYIHRVDRGIYGSGGTNGQNLSLDHPWISYDGAVTVEYGLYFDKTNALKIRGGEILSPTMDGLYIGESNNAGWDVISDTAFDVCGRHAVNVVDGGKFELNSCWGKGGEDDSLSGNAVLFTSLLEGLIMGGHYEVVTTPAISNTHHVIVLDTCETTGVIGPYIYGNGSTELGDGVYITGGQYNRVIGPHCANIQRAVREAGGTDFNVIDLSGVSGHDSPNDPIVLVGAGSIALGIGHYGSAPIKPKFYGALIVGDDLWVYGTDLKLGASAKRALIEAGANLEISAAGDFTGVEIKPSSYTKVTSTLEVVGILTADDDLVVKGSDIKLDAAGALRALVKSGNDLHLSFSGDYANVYIDPLTKTYIASATDIQGALIATGIIKTNAGFTTSGGNPGIDKTLTYDSDGAGTMRTMVFEDGLLINEY